MKTSTESLEKLIELVRRHGIHQLSVEEAGTKISITATPPQGSAPSMFAGMPPMAPQSFAVHHAPPPPQPAHADHAAPAAAKKPVPSGKVIKSPFVGTFYRS